MVNIDKSWLTDLQEKGFKEETLGNYQALVEELTVIETSPWHYEEKGSRTKAVSEGTKGPVVCSICNYKGHSAPDCWGECGKCGRYGHMTSKSWGVPKAPAPTAQESAKAKAAKEKLKHS